MTTEPDLFTRNLINSIQRAHDDYELSINSQLKAEYRRSKRSKDEKDSKKKEEGPKVLYMAPVGKRQQKIQQKEQQAPTVEEEASSGD